MVISVTTTGGAPIAMDDSNIIALVANPDNASYADITYQDNKNVLKKITVTSTAAVVAALSADIISLNVFNDSSFGSYTARYFNANRISPVIVDNTSHRLLTYNSQGFIYDQLAIQDPLSSIVSTINQGSSEFVTIAGVQTITGAKTFSAATSFTSTVAHTGAVTITDVNVVLGTTTGSKIGSATSQKLGFWNATPIVQPTTAVASAANVGGVGTTVKVDDTFGGYTIAQVVKALQLSGLLA